MPFGGMTFEQMRERHDWIPIRDCPGRFVVRGESGTLSLAELCGMDSGLRSYRSEKARDEIWIARLEGGGMLSYRRADGTWLHTLNTEEGLKRKVAQLGLDWE